MRKSPGFLNPGTVVFRTVSTSFDFQVDGIHPLTLNFDFQVIAGGVFY